MDFFRGIAILDMILVHFSGFMPPLISKIVDYTDFAMEGFVLVAGYMVGRKYYHDFASRWKQVVWKLYSRALQLYAIHAVMVLTINVPLFYLLYDERRTGQFGAFLLNSLLLLNQIGLMHILPAFIPLYLVSPLILYFSRRHGTWVLIFSFALFGIGNFHPYLLDLGEKTIFPFILWQVYFVAGCFMGIRSLDPGKGKAVHPNTRFSLAALFMAIMMILKHFKIIDPSMISKFPLNFPGLLYGVSIPAFLYTFILR
ncbi:MAG: OpgC domain-containing protein, partial [Syntrophales bacterium]